MSNTNLNSPPQSTDTKTLSEDFFPTDLEPVLDHDELESNEQEQQDDDDNFPFTTTTSSSATAFQATANATASFEHIKLKTLQALYGIQVIKKKSKHTRMKQKHDYYKGYEYTYDLSLLRDKSPKGSVDEGIRSLVDLLNAHPCYSTLSSCSGRITLFDPAGVGVEGNVNVGKEEDAIATSQVSSKSGKGHGTWLLSIHDQITTTQLYNALEQHHEKKMQLEQEQQQQHHHQQQQPQERSPCLLFQHEPLLLHVAASNLKRAQQLLKIALELGFRESGIMLSSKKITVAIRTHGLSLVVPLVSLPCFSGRGSASASASASRCSNDGSGQPLYSYEYLEELVYQANHRFVLNQEKLQRLEETIRQVLFRPKQSVSTSVGGMMVGRYNKTTMDVELESDDIRPLDVVECTWDSSKIPPLGLWGHTAVAIQTDRIEEEGETKGMTKVTDLLVMGGYGTGPPMQQQEGNKGCGGPSRRSDRIYRLRRYGMMSGQWDECWIECQISNPVDHDNSVQVPSPAVVNVGGFAAVQVSYSAREKAASCVMPQNLNCHSMPLIVLFGGRESPSRPKDDLVILSYDANNNGVTMFSPWDVRGDIPEARWGHSLTALSGRQGRVALLVGGRNEKDVLSSAYVLSVCTITKNDNGEQLESQPQSQRNEHSEVNSYFVWEKISQAIPRFFHCASRHSSGNHSIEQIVIHGGLFSTALLPQKEQKEVEYDTIILTLNPDDNKDCSLDNIHMGNSVAVFGGAMCSITNFAQPLLLCSGGVVSSPTKSNMKNEGQPLDEELFDRSLLQAMTVVCNSTRAHGDASRRNELKMFTVTHQYSSNNDHEERIDAGSMVHHCCIEIPPWCTTPSVTEDSNDGINPKPLPQDNVAEIVLIGGGVPLFAFGPCFAKSHHVTIRSCNNKSAATAAANHGSIHQPTTSVRSKNQISSQKTSSLTNNNTKTTKSRRIRKRETNVIFVHKSHAKQVKTALEEESLLDKNYRMIKIENDMEQGMAHLSASNHIAIPVTKECLNVLSSHMNNAAHGRSDWLEHVVTSGKYVVPFSSSVLGRRGFF
jgi:Uncharacterized conserved protein